MKINVLEVTITQNSLFLGIVLNTKGNKDCIHVDSQYKLGWETNECTDNRDYCAGVMAGNTHFRVTWEVAG